MTIIAPEETKENLDILKTAEDVKASFEFHIQAVGDALTPLVDKMAVTIISCHQSPAQKESFFEAIWGEVQKIYEAHDLEIPRSFNKLHEEGKKRIDAAKSLLGTHTFVRGMWGAAALLIGGILGVAIKERSSPQVATITLPEPEKKLEVVIREEVIHKVEEPVTQKSFSAPLSPKSGKDWAEKTDLGNSR